MQSKYTEKVLYHSKAGYLKIGNDDVFAPLSLELGLEMATLFGGTSYRFDTTDPAKVARGGTGLKHFLHAFVPGGYEVSEADIVYKNVEGNHLGSWLMRANYNSDTWRFSVYMDKFFEDHSAMLQLDYDGYGEGDKWNTRTKSRYLLYDFKDMLFGAELNFKYGSWLRNILFEYVYTKYQSGPIYHDRTRNLPDHVAGVDEFYNHLIYTGWQHWGQVMGNPLFLSPQYNKDGVIDIRDNRFVAYHLGLEGTPFDNLDYRFMATYRRGYGTYHTPYNKPKESFHMMLESTYRFKHGWTVSGALAMDFGRWLKRQAGVQLTVSKKGIFNL